MDRRYSECYKFYAVSNGIFYKKKQKRPTAM